MNDSDTHPDLKQRKDAFSRVAFWQFMSFIFLLCFIWVNETFDLAARMFGTPEAPFSFPRGCLLSAAVITAAIVAVGHTYETQKKLISNIVKTCLYCHRVKTEHGTWEHVEEYFIRQFPVAIDRKPCPECSEMLNLVDNKSETDTKEEVQTSAT